MNKWLTIILLLIITAGTFIPCCSVDDCCIEQQATTTNREKHTNEGACSPFFACTTCPGFVALATPIQLAEPYKELTIHHQGTVTFQLPSYFSSFWQPPRSC
ncbi:hypothetical protein [Flavisolibacter tropicus]|uniref:Uncharacterized protein n=1 Tax=Flavisolibacter tropicus TaxID=1492898 RepID=A0A172TZG5_9BACT|nr:hypothetical protein [Flavisolibacter tropicus]ANE52137.1 hypothetical protein SY85_18215 [Flavisolibacter tropicus]